MIDKAIVVQDKGDVIDVDDVALGELERRARVQPGLRPGASGRRQQRRRRSGAAGMDQFTTIQHEDISAVGWAGADGAAWRSVAFMPAISKYVINLEDRTDRRAEMEQQLRRVGWQAAFVPAIRPADAADFPSVGARGCFLSHLATLNRPAGGHVLLMEDDLDFVPDFAQLWDSAYG